MIMVFLLFVSNFTIYASAHTSVDEQPLSKIAVHKAIFALRDSAAIRAYPPVLGLKVTPPPPVYFVHSCVWHPPFWASELELKQAKISLHNYQEIGLLV